MLSFSEHLDHAAKAERMGIDARFLKDRENLHEIAASWRALAQLTQQLECARQWRPAISSL